MILVNKFILDFTFKHSNGWMTAKYRGVVVFTFNINKSGVNIFCSIPLVNRNCGNLLEHMRPISITEGPVSECYENKLRTIF